MAPKPPRGDGNDWDFSYGAQGESPPADAMPKRAKGLSTQDGPAMTDVFAYLLDLRLAAAAAPQEEVTGYLVHLPMRVRKAVIPAAGLGTRFLPATKAVPKEMLPIVDVPTIQLIVEEAVAAGIEEIVLVNGRGKGSIEDHFDHAYELEDTLRRRGKTELADQMARIAGMVRMVSIRQKQPLGLGHAVLVARDAIGDEPFAVMLGDDLYDAPRPAVGQLIDVYARTGLGAVAVMEVPAGQEHMYGVVAGERGPDGLVRVTDMVEKPAPGTAPSRLAIVGRYVLPPEIWPILEVTKPGKGGEIQLTDALLALARSHGMHASMLDGVRHDAGDKLGYLRANLSYALKRPELADGVRALCREILSL